MPKKKKNLSEVYSRNDLKQMPILASVVLYDFLGNYKGISEPEKKTLLRQMTDLQIMSNNPDYIIPIYGEAYPKLASQLSEDNVDNFPEMLGSNTGKTQNYYLGMNPTSMQYPQEIIEEPLQTMQGAMKTISKHLDKQIKKGRIADYEKQFLQSYKQIIDVYADGRNRNDVVAKNPAYLVNESILGAMLRFKNYTVRATEKDRNVDFELDPGDMNSDWMRTVGSINETPIYNTIIKGAELQNKIEAYDNGDATTADMIKAYEEYAKVSGEMVNMPKEEFDKIYKLGQLQNRYDNFVLGPRTPHYAHYDAAAKAQLLKAGYSMEDAMAMAQFYTIMKEAYRKENLLDENKRSQETFAACDKMEEVWNKITTSGDLTEEKRAENLAAMQQCMSDIKKDVEKGTIKSGSFSKDIVDNLSGTLGQRKDVVLDANDKVKLSGTPKDLYEHIKSVDSKVIRSSKEFRKMKSDLKKLAEVDKEKFPEKYEYLKQNAIKSTDAYIKYKNKELNDPKNSHKRSDYEYDRVKASSAVLDRLQTIDRKDFEAAQLKDKRFVVNEDMSYKNARAFVKSKWVMDHGIKLFKEELENWKAILVNTQGLENQDKNFDNKKEMVGSDSYKNLTVALQDCLDKLNDPNTIPSDQKKAFIELYKKADVYRKDHEGVLFGPVSGEGQTRQEMSTDMCKKIPGFVTCYDNMRRQFEPCKDANGISYMDKPFAEISEHADEFLEIHKEQFLKDPVIQHQRIFDNMYHASLGQRQLLSVISSKNRFMAQNYRTDIKPDHYLAVKENMSVSEMAKNYVTMKYMDRMYKLGVKPGELQTISDELKNGQLEKDAEKLANNPAFKAVCKNSPGKAFSSWKAVERKADSVQKLAENNIQKLLSTKEDGKFESAEDYLDSLLRVDEGLGKVMTNQFIASPSGRFVAEAIAADSSAKPEVFIEMLEQKADAAVKNYYQTHHVGNRLEPKELMKDPAFKSKLQADLIGVQDAVFKKNAASVNRPKKNLENQVKNMEQSPLGI